VELYGKSRNQQEYKGFQQLFKVDLSPHFVGFNFFCRDSQFQKNPAKIFKKSNESQFGTDKPDRITVDQRGWRVEGEIYFTPSANRLNRYFQMCAKGIRTW
jgi:hypothetical protein